MSSYLWSTQGESSTKRDMTEMVMDYDKSIWWTASYWFHHHHKCSSLSYIPSPSYISSSSLSSWRYQHSITWENLSTSLAYCPRSACTFWTSSCSLSSEKSVGVYNVTSSLIYPPIHPFIHPSIHPFIHLFWTSWYCRLDMLPLHGTIARCYVYYDFNVTILHYCPTAHDVTYDLLDGDTLSCQCALIHHALALDHLAIC